MEVLDITDFEDDGKFQIRKINVRLNCNMMSMTLEKLLGMRKKQVAELCGIASRDIVKHDNAADIPTRADNLQKTSAALDVADSQQFNDNKFFLDISREIQDLMPQIGDEIQCLKKHTKDVYGLIATDSAGGFASSSWDGTAQLWSADEKQVYTCVGEQQLPAASLALGFVSSERLVSAQLDGGLAVQSHKGVNPSTTMLRTGDHTGVVSLSVLHGEQTEHVEVSIDASEKDSSPTPAVSAMATLMVSGTQSGKIVLWDLANELEPKELQSIGGDDGHSDVVRALVWAPKNEKETYVVSGAFDSQIIVWHLDTSTGLLVLDKHLCDHSCSTCSSANTAHRGAVTALVYSGKHGDSQCVVASGSEDGAVKLWDLESGHVGPIRTVSTYSRGVCSLAWLAKPQHSADGPAAWLASGLGDTSIVISDPNTGKDLAVLRGHDGPIHSLLWLQSKGWLVSGSADSTVRTWRVRSDPNVVQGVAEQKPTATPTLTATATLDEGVPPEALPLKSGGAVSLPLKQGGAGGLPLKKNGGKC